MNKIEIFQNEKNKKNNDKNNQKTNKKCKLQGMKRQDFINI